MLKFIFWCNIFRPIQTRQILQLVSEVKRFQYTVCVNFLVQLFSLIITLRVLVVYSLLGLYRASYGQAYSVRLPSTSRESTNSRLIK